MTLRLKFSDKWVRFDLWGILPLGSAAVYDVDSIFINFQKE